MQELGTATAYKQTPSENNTVGNDHCDHLLIQFPVNVKDRQDKIPTMYWLPKLYKNHIKHDLFPAQAHVFLLNFHKVRGPINKFEN